METEEMIKNDVCWLLNAVLVMREHQRKYFAHRFGEDKIKAMQAEKAVDEICKRLKIRGYIRPPDSTQPELKF